MFNFRYILLSPHNANTQESQDLLNKVYDTWGKTFSNVVEDTGGQLDKDDFFRYDLIGVLMHGNSIVGSHCYSLFNLKLNCCLEHHFFQNISSEVIQQLIKDGQSLVYSLEYSQISPEFRKGSGNIRWIDVLIGCALKYLDNSDANGIIGTPRTDIKVDKTTFRLGAVEIQPPIKKMNYECAVIYFPKKINRHFDNPLVAQYVQFLWKNHHDLTFTTISTPRKSA